MNVNESMIFSVVGLKIEFGVYSKCTKPSNQKAASHIAFTGNVSLCRRFLRKSDDTKILKTHVADKTDDQILKTAHTNCFFWAALFFDIGFDDDDVKIAHMTTGLL